MRKRKGNSAFWMGLVVMFLTINMSSYALSEAIPESKDPIKLSINDWTGQHITTHVAGEIIKKMGYNVKYVTAGYYPQLVAIRDNTITAVLELWSSNIGEHYAKALASGDVEELGDLGIKPVETWWYNNYAKEKCPGLPDWKALKKCQDVFASAETFPKGRLVDYPADWGTSNVDRIKALDLPFVSISGGTEGAIIAEMKAAEARKKPLLVMFFSPHWVFAAIDLHKVALPPYEEGCYDDPSVGINPNVTWDCDWKRGSINKLAWKGMKDKWPAAHKFLKAFQLRNEDQIQMMKAIDQEGRKLEDVVNEWIDANKSVWKPWVENATQQ